MTSDREHREWLNEYPSLKQVIANNPFTVPEGYFSESEQRIISGVRLSELVKPSAQDFTVPENYFEELSSNIVSRINIEENIKAGEQSFTVPEGYFEDMAQQLQSRIAIEESLEADEQNFTVPQGYFEDMAQQLQSRIAIEEALKAGEQSFAVPQGYFEDMAMQINSRVAVEDALAAETPFTVPDNYFEKLNRSILDQTAALESENRRGVIRKLISTTAFKYATAACFALVVGAAIFIQQMNTPAEHNSTYLHKALSNVPDNAIESYLELHMDATDANANIDQADKGTLNNVSEADLADYLSNI